MEKEIRAVNLRLKQLVALEALRNIHEGYDLFYDDNDLLAEEVDADTRIMLREAALARYKNEFHEATDELYDVED